MKINPTTVDEYLAEGCGRCSLGGTPECKVHKWDKELARLRSILLACGLTEEIKWSQPCYTYGGNNILLMTAFKDYCCLAFFKGVLLKDSTKLLTAPGENSQAVRQLRFTDVKDIIRLETTIKAYIFEAIEVEKTGLKVNLKKEQDPMPEELQQKLDGDPALKTAFEALTPGRQRGYILHFSQPKQSATRILRIEKNIPKIMAGKGFYDR